MADRERDRAFTLKSSLGHLLRRAQKAAEERFAERLRDLDLTSRQFALLAAISDNPKRSQQSLVAVTGIDRSTLADTIQRMERRGLIARSDDEGDRRAKSVSLTPRGEEVLEAALPQAHAVDMALIALLPKKAQTGFLKALKELAGQSVDSGAAEEPAPAPVGKKAGGKKAKAAKAESAKAKPKKEKKKAGKRASGKKDAKAERGPAAALAAQAGPRPRRKNRV